MLHRVRVVLSGDDELLDAEELLDALWLAARLPPAAATALARAATAAESRAAAADRTAGAATAGLASERSDEDRNEDRQEKASPSADTGAGSDAAQGNGLHAAPASAERQAAHSDRAAMAVRTPGVKALEGAELRLGRALRPLKQLRTDVLRTELDVNATVSAIAETGLPEAVLRPARTRWLDLALLVDDGVSMLLWQQLAGEIRGLMERCGAFRHVRVHGLDSRDPAGPRLSSRPYGETGATLPLSTVHDPSGNTLLLVVSDGVGRAWRDGSMHQALLRAASAGPTAVVHALPRRLWAGSGINAEPWKVTTRRRGAANRSWHIEDPVLPPELAPYDGVPVPVLAMDGSSLATWARLIGSPEDTAVLPLLTLPGSPAPTTGDRAFGRQDTVGDAEEAVLRFRAAASSDAYRLAAHLAAVAPLPVPAMRLVQHAVTPAVDTSHLAEVFLGGLMHGVDGSENVPHQKTFDFTDETRRVLLGTVPPAELVRTSHAVTTHLAELAGSSAGFPAWLPHPEGPDRVRSGTRGPFGWVDDTLRRRLGVSLPDTSGPEPEPLPSRGELRELPEGFALDPELTGWRRLSVADPRFEGRDALPYDVFAEHDGGWSEVGMFLAHDGEGRVLVVRVPDVRHALELVATEVAALKRMDGVYAPRLMAWGASHDRPWLAVDCALDGTREPAPNLRAFTQQQGVLHQAALVAVARQLASGLSRAHQRGLVHGSLTPNCVLIAGRDVQIARWTTASLNGRSSRYRSRYEPNPRYRAPELEEAATDPTEEADVYALGIILLEAATGRKESADLLEGLRSSKATLSPELVAILRACTHTDPARRPSVARLLRAFDSLADGQDAERHPLTVTLGLNADLDTVELALESEHRGGQGPHLLCLGRPARVRRDLIGRVLEQLTRQARTGMELIVADYDGRSGLARFEGAVSGSSYLNLRDDTTHALSLCEKLRSEIGRRRHVLETITAHNDIGKLENAAFENALLPRLPRLVVAVENFPRILRSAPEVLTVMQQVARAGPQLGIHLILFADDLEQLRAAHGFLDMMPTRIDLQPIPPSEGNSTEPPSEGAALFVQSDSRPLFFTT
ncbi:protein kinase [Streptomyces sp. ISL-44]|uniref:SAV_2336 N-terminal domain-related protein n=1 Tax=Streptomyces sp. ISL-44 TaxID=2819184 RepID=UPI001BE7CEC7|nr:SAV_2336 N-terminal domain-related protein [Streptomyces sp. ISL-44]MBT2544235.1 protein kinase [Streptomyces sp. ISL-44]